MLNAIPMRTTGKYLIVGRFPIKRPSRDVINTPNGANLLHPTQRVLYKVEIARMAPSVVIQPDEPRAAVTLLLRNAPVDNRIVLQAGAWTRVLQMAPGEEQRVEVPVDATHGASLLRVEAGSGFRPSEREPASRDQRFLGVWVKVEG